MDAPIRKARLSRQPGPTPDREAAPAADGKVLTPEAGAPAASSPLADPGVVCACLEARMTARALTRMYDEALRPTGLKVTQLSLLAAIARGASGSISSLAGRLALERTTLTRNLQLLKNAGLIAPRTDAGRAVAYSLTARGHDALTQATPLWRTAQQTVERTLGAGGWADARASLKALRRTARGAVEAN